MFARLTHFVSVSVSVLFLTVSMCGCPEKPTADFCADTTAGDAPLTVAFLDLSAPGELPISSWLWLFGDGESSTQQDPTHTYSATGTYIVSLTVATVMDKDMEMKLDFIILQEPSNKAILQQKFIHPELTAQGDLNIGPRVFLMSGTLTCNACSCQRN